MRDEPPTTLGVRTARWVAVALALAALSPLPLGLDAVWDEPASHQFPWCRAIERRATGAWERAEGPRVLLVGGSSVAFGVDPGRLSAEVGRPVVALGVHAGVGLDLVAERAVGMLRAGDVVVVAPELTNFDPARPGDPLLRSDWRAVVLGEPAGAERWWAALRGRAGRVVRGVELGLGGAARPLASVVGVPTVSRLAAAQYRPEAIGALGTVVTPRPASVLTAAGLAKAWGEAAGLSFSAESRGGLGLRRLAEVGRERGVRLLVMPPAMVAEAGEDPAARGRRLDLEGRMLGLAESMGYGVLLPAGATTVPREMGLDTFKHLNDLGVAEVHGRLSPALRRALAE